MKSSVRIYSLLILGAFLMLAQAACKKENLKNRPTVVVAELKSDAGGEQKSNLITIISHITDDGGLPVTERGICYTTSESDDVKEHYNPSVNGFKLRHTDIGAGLFTTTLNLDNANTTYIVRAYAITRAGVAYSNPLRVKALPYEEKKKHEKKQGDEEVEKGKRAEYLIAKGDSRTSEEELEFQAMLTYQNDNDNLVVVEHKTEDSEIESLSLKEQLLGMRIEFKSKQELIDLLYSYLETDKLTDAQLIDCFTKYQFTANNKELDGLKTYRDQTVEKGL